MSLNGSGVAVINSSGQPVVASTLITSAAFNAATADIATMISTCVMKDGQQTITANLPMGTFKITGLGDGTLIQDATTIKNIQNGTGVYVGTVGGTSDVITLSPAPAITAYVVGQTFRFIAGGANTTNVTVAVSGLAAKAITKNGTTALVANDILSAQMVSITYDGTRFILGTHLTADIVTLTGSQVLTNKTLTTPTIASLTNTVLTTSTVAADPVTALGIASKQYVDALTTGAYASFNAAGTVSAGTRFVALSGASFTLVLSNAAGHTGESITLTHAGTSLSQVYTLDAVGAQTIDGTLTYLLYTNGESITIVSDGSNWKLVSHYAETDWVDAGAMTITGTSSDPTKPTTPDYDHVFWMRKGKEAYVKWILQISSAAGAADGSGAYLFAIPTGIAIDNTVTPSPVATAWATGTMSEGIRALVSGRGKVAIDSSGDSDVLPFAYDTTTVQWVRDDSFTPVGSGGYPMTTAEMGYVLEVHFQAANWRI